MYEIKMTTIQDLDGFVQFVENETTAGRLDKDYRDDIINAVDVVQNAIDELNY